MRKIKSVLPVAILLALSISTSYANNEGAYDAKDSDDTGTTYVWADLYSTSGRLLGLTPTVDVTRDSELTVTTSGGGDGGVSVSVTVDVFDDIDIFIPGTIANAVELKSANNKVGNCYYRPKIEELTGLDTFVEEQYHLAEAYTGFFNTDWVDEYKPTQSRALEILGYDFLLRNEEFSVDAFGNWSYTPTSAPSIVTKGIAVMDIYKALGCSKYTFKFFNYPTEHTFSQSPAISSLSGILENSEDKIWAIDVGVTRTNEELYYEKAERDLRIPRGDMGLEITGEQFIILLKEMMYFYGEPVLNQQEMNQLLQVYGATVPSYLTTQGQDAYLYLKSRGVLNVDLDFNSAMTLDNMLEILMCVADTGSRSNYKEIQLTMDIGDIASKGYFSKQVYLETNDNSIIVPNEDAFYDYSKSQLYDYYIEVTEQTQFKSSSGGLASYLFIPSEPNNERSVELQGSSYKGVEISEDGKQYYHFQVSIMEDNAQYFDYGKRYLGKNQMLQINSREASDFPYYLWLEQGGGVYTVSSISNDGKEVLLQRRAFTDDEFIGSSSIERVQSVSDSISYFDTVKSFFASLFKVNASSTFRDVLSSRGVSDNTGTYNSVGVTNPMIVKIKIVNASFITAVPYSAIRGIEFDDVNDTWTVELLSKDKAYFLSKIERRQSSIGTLSALSTLNGSYMVDYSKFAELGYVPVVSDYTSLISDVDKAVLSMNTIYGDVILNNTTKEIIVGDIVYALPDTSDVQLWYQTIVDGKPVCMVDVRAFFGWTSDKCSITFTGDGQGGTFNIQKNEPENEPEVFKVVTKLCPGFMQVNKNMTEVGVEQSLAVNGSEHGYSGLSLLLSNQSLFSNWILYECYSKSDGSYNAYVFRFVPKDAYLTFDIPPTDLTKEFQTITKHEFSSNSWTTSIFDTSKLDGSVVGGFYNDSRYGWLYNIPQESEFTIEKYLSGEYPLPIYYEYDATNKPIIRSANVNYFNGFTYGTRGYIGSSGRGTIDIFGEKTPYTDEQLNNNIRPSFVIPASVSPIKIVFGGNSTNQYYKSTQPEFSSIINSDSKQVCFFGTTYVVPKLSSTGEISRYTISYAYNEKDRLFKSEFNWDLKPSDDLLFYKVFTEWKGNNSSNYSYVYAAGDTSMNTSYSNDNVSNEQSVIVNSAIGDVDEKYSEFKELSVDYMINKIDASTSWIIYFSVTILPMIGIIAVTLLVLFCFLAPIKFIQVIVHRTIDPVKLLTIGRYNIDTLSFKNSFVSLMIAYILFALLLNGNVLRIIAYMLSIFNRFVSYLH